MSKVTLSMGIAAAVAGGCVVVLVWQRQALAGLRGELAELEQQAGQVDALETENKRLRETTVDPDELERLRKGHTELMRLRSEVGQLRREIQELRQGKLATAPSTRPPAPPPLPPRLPNPASGASLVPMPAREAAFLPSDSWADVGLETPEAAFQTLHWAMRVGNLERMAEALLLPPEAPPPGSELVQADLPTGGRPGAAAESPDTVTHDLLADMADAHSLQDVLGSRVLTQNQVAPDAVELSVELERADGTRLQVPMTFKRVGQEWKLAPTMMAPTMIGLPAGAEPGAVVPRK